MKRITLLFLCLWAVLSQAQTLVNQELFDTLSHPTQRYGYIKVLPDGAGNYVLLYNILYTGGEKENYQLIKINSSGVPVASYEFNSLHNGSDFGTNLYIKGNYAYSCGFTIDSPLGTHRINAVKLNMSRWDTVWTISESIDSITASQAPFSILVDDSESVYIAGTVQTPTSYKMTAVKYDLNGVRQWVTSYDTTGYTTVGAAMTINGDNYLAVTGTRFDNMGHSDFVTAYLDPTTGIAAGQKIEKNGIGAIGSPIGIVTDMDGNNYIAGTSTVSGQASVVKLVKYDSLYNKQWAVTWGDSSQRQIAAAMSSDIGGNNFIAGTKLNANGTSDLFVVSFGADGSLLSTVSVPSTKPNEGYVAKDIARDDFGGFYVTGYKYTGMDSDLVTVAFDDQAHIKWMRTFNRCSGCQESAYNVGISDDGTTVLVSGKSEGSDSLYFIMKYEQWSPVPCGYSPCPEISYTFGNGQITQAGTDTFLEYDIYARQNNPTLAYVGGLLTLTYNTEVFGENIVDSGNVLVTREEITYDTNYTYTLNDTLFKSDAIRAGGSEFIINIENTNSSTLYYIADTPQKLCHVKMKFKRCNHFYVGFDKFFMENKSFFSEEPNIPYTYVNAESSLGLSSATTLTYSIGNTQFLPVGSTPTYFVFNVIVSADNMEAVSDAGIYLLFDPSVVSLNYNTGLSLPTWTGSTYSSTGDPIYDAYALYNLNFPTSNDLYYQVNKVGTFDPTDQNVHVFPYNGSAEPFVIQVLMNIIDCNGNPNVRFALGSASRSVTNEYVEDQGGGRTMPYTFNIVTNNDPILRSNFSFTCLTGTQNLSSNVAVKLFPNPTSGTLAISAEATIKDCNVTLKSVLGQELYTKHFEDLTHEKIELPSSLSKGIYYFTVKGHDFENTQKILIE